MATSLKYLVLILALFLSGCFKTELPVYQSYSTTYKTKSSYASYHTVRAGETLYSLGRRFGVSYKTLARRNHIRYPYTIYIGQRIYLKTHAPRSRRLPVANHQYKKSHRKVVKKNKKRRVVSKATKKGQKTTRLRWPVQGVVTSRFGRRGSRMHDGIDIGAKEGTPIYAVASGEVVYSDQRLSGYGKLIIVRHRYDLFTAYAHNQRNLVRKGAKVKAGDIIARVGQTGRATGPHLHFEVRRGPTPVDPLAYLPRR